MNPYVDKMKMQMRTKLMQYATLLDYRYKNLCVETSAEALLPVEVTIDTKDLTLEQVAKSAIIDNEHFLIAPNNISYQVPISKAFFQTHPQLKQDFYDPMDNPYSSDKSKANIKQQKDMFREQMGEELTLPQILILTTPEVNDDVKDQLNKTVDALNSQCEVLCQKVLVDKKSELAIKMAQAKPEELKKANSELDDEYNKNWHDIEVSTENEHQAIERANQRYHERKKQNEQNEDEKMNDIDYQKSHSMKFGEYEE